MAFRSVVGARPGKRQDLLVNGVEDPLLLREERAALAFGGFLSKYALFLCPIMMIFMVPMMLKGRTHKH